MPLTDEQRATYLEGDSLNDLRDLIRDLYTKAGPSQEVIAATMVMIMTLFPKVMIETTETNLAMIARMTAAMQETP